MDFIHPRHRATKELYNYLGHFSTSDGQLSCFLFQLIYPQSIEVYSFQLILLPSVLSSTHKAVYTKLLIFALFSFHLSNTQTHAFFSTIIQSSCYLSLLLIFYSFKSVFSLYLSILFSLSSNSSIFILCLRLQSRHDIVVPLSIFDISIVCRIHRRPGILVHRSQLLPLWYE